MRITENKTLIVLTIAAIAISAFAGAAAQAQKAQAAALAAAQKAKAKRRCSRCTTSTVVPSPVSGTQPVPSTSVTTTSTTTTTTSTTTTTKRTAKAAAKKTAKTSSTTTTATVAVRAAAVGDLVQYGSYKGSAPRWRILSLDAKRIVLLSEEALVASPFQSNEYVDDANDYASSSVRSWLNDQFVPAAFGADAQSDPVLGRSSASDVIAGDVAYLLTPSQLDRYLPEADDRVCFSSAWGQANSGPGGSQLAAGAVYWWLAPEPGAEPSNTVAVVQTNGGVNTRRYTAIATDGIRPAIKLKTSAVKLTAVKGASGLYLAAAK